jgi:hypothetical protein
MQRPPTEVAVVMRDGTARIVDVGAPAQLVWLSDHYPDADLDRPGLAAYAMTARLVHHVVDPERPFDEWIDDVELLADADEEVDRVRAQLAGHGNGTSPTPAVDERAPAPAAQEERV